jgi:hypothetical protein
MDKQNLMMVISFLIGSYPALARLIAVFLFGGKNEC